MAVRLGKEEDTRGMPPVLYRVWPERRHLPSLFLRNSPGASIDSLQVYLLWGKDMPELWKELDGEFLTALRRRWTDNQQRTKRSSCSHLEVSQASHRLYPRKAVCRRFLAASVCLSLRKA